MASQIEAYGLIGNTHTSALVSRSGSIDWLCAPRFDSDACFTALLGYDEHGRWALRPTVKVRESEQRYRDDSMILETEFTCDGGVAHVIDFMPMGGRCEIVRIVEGVDGEVPLEMLLDVRFCYGAEAPSIEKIGDGTCFLAGQDALILRSPLVLEQASQRVSAYLRVKKGRSLPDTARLVRAARGASRGHRCRASAGVHGVVLASVVRALRLRRPLAGRCGALADHAQSDDLRSYRSHRCRSDDILAGGYRGCSQLGLSLLLVAGRNLNAGRVQDRGLHRRSPGVSRLAVTRYRGQRR